MFSGKQLIKARKEIGMSRTDLLFALDKEGFRLSSPTLCRWEIGRSIPNANQLAKLAMFFGKGVSYFFDSKHNRPCPSTNK